MANTQNNIVAGICEHLEAVPGRVCIQEIAIGLSRCLGLEQQALERMLIAVGRQGPTGEFADTVLRMANGLLKERPGTLQLAYVIAKRDLADYWRAWHTRQHYGLSVGLPEQADSEEARQVQELRLLQESLIYGSEWTLVDDLDAKTLLTRMPESIVTIVQKRLDGLRLKDAERQTLHRWLKNGGRNLVHSLLLAS